MSITDKVQEIAELGQLIMLQGTKAPHVVRVGIFDRIEYNPKKRAHKTSIFVHGQVSLLGTYTLGDEKVPFFGLPGYESRIGRGSSTDTQMHMWYGRDEIAAALADPFSSWVENLEHITHPFAGVQRAVIKPEPRKSVLVLDRTRLMKRSNLRGHYVRRFSPLETMHLYTDHPYRIEQTEDGVLQS